MCINQVREASLLSYALELAATCSSVFHGHVCGLISDVLSGEYSVSDLSDLHEVRDEIAMFRDESPVDWPIDLPVGMSIQQVTPDLVDMAFSELVGRVKWDIVMAKNPHATEFLVKLVREMGHDLDNQE